MPAIQQTVVVGTVIGKVWNGVNYRATVLRVDSDGVVTGVKVEMENGSGVWVGVGTGWYGSLTAAAKAIRNDGGRSVNGWAFFGLVNPVAIQRTSPQPLDGGGEAKVKGKCSRVGCYEPADCSHGFCASHCGHNHNLRSNTHRTYPRCQACHIGVEVEVEYRDQHGYRRGLPMGGCRDGSLGSFGAEHKLLAKADKIEVEAAELVEELFKRGARSSRRCGLHVHIDVRQVSEARVAEMRAWAYRTQGHWFTLVPPSRRNNQYIYKLQSETDAGSHYTWFHRTPYSTVEVRLHGGTLNPFKMAGWLNAMVHLQAKANDEDFAFPNTGDARADFWAVFEDCPATGKEYLRAREANGGVITDRAYRHVEE